MTARVIGLGGRAAGDDRVGLEVVRRLREQGAGPGVVEVVGLDDPSGIVELLADAEHVVLVDALAVGEGVGSVRVLREEEIDDEARAVSSHALGLVQAVALARVLHGDRFCKRLDLVGVGIEPPATPGLTMSPEVQDAVPVALRIVRELLEAGDA